MNSIVHRPSGSGHPYRIDPDQRHPVELVAGEPFEVRALAAAGVSAVDVEFGDGAVHPAVSVSANELYADSSAGADDHLSAASGARPDVGAATLWRWTGSAPVGGTVRYRFVVDGVGSDWFDAPVGTWERNLGELRIVGDAEQVAVGDVEWLIADGAPVRVRASVALSADQRVVGFGERFDVLDQRGRQLDTVVFEQYKNQGHRSYLPSPFWIAVGAESFGVHLRTSRRVRFDVGAVVADAVRFEVAVDSADPLLELRAYAGTPAAIVAAHVADIGGLRRPPDWAFQPWMSANNWNTQARIVEEVERGRQLGVPAGVIVVEAWSDESTFTVFRDARYEPRPDGSPLSLAEIEHPAEGAWPDPAGLVDYLHERDVRLVLWQIPIVPTDRGNAGQVGFDAATMIERGYCVAEADGTPYRNRGWWFPGGLLPDWTNDEARQWWLNKRRYLVAELGIDGFKTDGGEHAWGDELRYHDGSRGDTGNNRYPNQYAAAYHELLDDCGVDGVTFSRAGFTGAGATPCHWAGDENSTWEAFRASITAGLSAGLSGVAFWSWDLAGFSGPLPSVELYVRSAAMAALCPLMQYHAEFDAGDIAVGGEASGLADPADPAERPRRRDRTPWNVADQHDDQRALTLYRRFAVLRQRLLPYLIEQADVSVASGLPMLRALCLDDSALSPARVDPAIWSHPYQYQLGDDLLVAPVCKEGADSVEVYVPAGDWVDVWDGTVHVGPTVVHRKVPLDEIAVFARADRGAEFSALFADLPDALEPQPTEAGSTGIGGV